MKKSLVLLSLAVICFDSCGRRDSAAKKIAIETALKPFEELSVPTGPRLNLGRDAAPTFRQLEVAGLVRLADVPQGYWDNFASSTFMEGTRPFKVMPTQKLNDLASNPRWKTPTNGRDLDQKTIISELEGSWNFYTKRDVFLGPNCFGRSTSFAHPNNGYCAQELMTDYPIYSALAKKGLITLTDINLIDVPPTAVSTLTTESIQRVMRASLTPEGQKLADLDSKNNVATFVFATHKVEQISKNTPLASSEGDYRLIEGTYVFNLKPQFADLWQTTGKPTYRERKVRVVYQYRDRRLEGCTSCKPGWETASTPDGRYSAQDDGPRNGDYSSAGVPATVDAILTKGRDDDYTWHIPVAHLKVGEVLRDEEYKGALATPGETFRLVLAKIERIPPDGGAAIPSELGSLLPGRLRSVLKYSDFNKQWQVVAIDVGPSDSDKWLSANVK
jgi:hypothetical protein